MDRSHAKFPTASGFKAQEVTLWRWHHLENGVGFRLKLYGCAQFWELLFVEQAASDKPVCLGNRPTEGVCF
jgi:hypothetical protein